MLVLSRKVGERLLIGEDIAVTVVKLTSGGVRLGIEAPPELSVVREELAAKMKNDDPRSPFARKMLNERNKAQSTAAAR